MLENKIGWIGVFILLLVGASRSKTEDNCIDTPTSGVIKIAVDESFQPVIDQEIGVFESIYTLAGIIPQYCSEVEAIDLLLKDSVRMAVTTRKLTSEERVTLENRKFFPKEIKIATDGIALIVNDQNQESDQPGRDTTNRFRRNHFLEGIGNHLFTREIAVGFRSPEFEYREVCARFIVSGPKIVRLFKGREDQSKGDRLCRSESGSNGSGRCQLVTKPGRFDESFFPETSESIGSEPSSSCYVLQ